MKKILVLRVLSWYRKRVFVLLGLGSVLCVLVFQLAGCGPWAKPGQTKAEVYRDHLRTSRIHKLELADDFDRALLVDKPSKLSITRIP